MFSICSTDLLKTVKVILCTKKLNLNESNDRYRAEEIPRSTVNSLWIVFC